MKLINVNDEKNPCEVVRVKDMETRLQHFQDSNIIGWIITDEDNGLSIYELYECVQNSGEERSHYYA